MASTNGKQALRVTPPDGWRKPVEPVTLPSGKVAAVKAIDLAAFILSGNAGTVPDMLLRQISDELSGKPVHDTMTAITPDDLPGFGAFINTVVLACVVEPRVVVGEAEYAAGQISIDDIDMADRMFIFQRAMPGEELAIASRFPAGPGGGVESVPESGDV